jgi:hypothetical protein
MLSPRYMRSDVVVSVQRAEQASCTMQCICSPAGKYQDQSGQPTCKTAPAGSYSGAGASSAPTCAPGTYSQGGACPVIVWHRGRLSRDSSNCRCCHLLSLPCRFIRSFRRAFLHTLYRVWSNCTQICHHSKVASIWIYSCLTCETCVATQSNTCAWNSASNQCIINGNTCVNSGTCSSGRVACTYVCTSCPQV